MMFNKLVCLISGLFDIQTFMPLFLALSLYTGTYTLNLFMIIINGTVCKLVVQSVVHLIIQLAIINLLLVLLFY